MSSARGFLNWWRRVTNTGQKADVVESWRIAKVLLIKKQKARRDASTTGRGEKCT